MNSIGVLTSRICGTDDGQPALPDRYGSLVIVAAYTGLRWGELAGLRVRDLDLLRRRLTVRSTLIEPSGEAPRL